ncbi:putative carbonic anhydrase [Gordonia araii NBRC 100433]|uniref:carbonic anhydrase n=1 Tax=Gordonia araii NBRC 100433 TaxID=1073574 RepID=G7GYU2_9ACTN|nr:bifunctional SulP family inorganic anion transporter/carbonic anhydrase [Gordonia araii]NNG96977.1 bifunctional SulP family inorganic anion transporter/carbonic anhydrase [Gordonia araii NBRC 100433]GAB08767.1 putative carbonic anhydrase [Gordonia araii NBRC 100433]
MNQPAIADRARAVARYDLPASIVVFLVALPLSLGIAIASHAPVAAGLIAAIVGGVVAGAIGGSALQVSGPAAGLTVVVAESINQFGFRTTCFIVVVAGILQILLGLSKVARAALAVAPVVVHAMLAGIGITIALQQVHVLLGGESRSSAWANVIALPEQVASLHGWSAGLGLMVVAIMFGWKYVPAKIRIVPAALAAIVVATIVSLAIPGEVKRVSIDGSLFDSIGLPELPNGEWSAVVLMIVTICLIASVESLLSAVAVDKMHSGERTNFDREMVGQGSANVLSGMIGGLPITGVIVRSSTNVMAGARTRASAILHGFWILVFSASLVGLVEQIPLAALAGLLVVIGTQLVKLSHVRLAHLTGDLVVYSITLLCVVFLNLLEGVLIGLAVAAALLIWRVVRVAVDASEIPGTGEWRVRIDGSATFLSLPKLTGSLQQVPRGAAVVVEMTVDFLDHAAFETIDEWARQHRANGGTVRFVEIGEARMDRAGEAPPSRSLGRATFDDIFASWRGSRRETDSSLAKGIADYNSGHAHLLRPHLDELRTGQDPEAFFLTCVDSRIVPNVITGSGPGDLFTVRNVGNIVPAHGDASVDSALEFALEVLSVETVVVCGHSACGAMAGLLSGRSGMPSIDRWLDNARDSLARYENDHPVRRAAAEAGYSEVDQLSMTNIAVQVERLRSHAAVLRAGEQREVAVAGIFFDIATAQVIEIGSSSIAVITGDDTTLQHLHDHDLNLSVAASSTRNGESPG